MYADDLLPPANSNIRFATSLLFNTSSNNNLGMCWSNCLTLDNVSTYTICVSCNVSVSIISGVSSVTTLVISGVSSTSSIVISGVSATCDSSLCLMKY